jgi:hypothetical protein
LGGMAVAVVNGADFFETPVKTDVVDSNKKGRPVLLPAQWGALFKFF